MDREKSDRLGRAFNRSVYSMLLVPLGLLVGLGTMIVLNVRARSGAIDVDVSDDSPL